MAAATTWAAVSAISSVVGGIFGASSQAKQNAEAKAAQLKAEKLAKKQAKITNEYNLKAFEAEKKDYFAAQQFQYDTAVKQWKYDTEIQDLQYVQDVKAYEASVENYGQQLFYNNTAYQAAKESNQASFNELLASAAFDRESMLVQDLERQGQAALGQAGVSSAKAMQALAAKQGRDLAVLRANINSGKDEYLRNFTDISLQKYGADMQAKANLMIKPESLPELLKPEIGPSKTFVKPAKVIPGAVPPAKYSNPMLPLISSVTSGASTIAQSLG